MTKRAGPDSLVDLEEVRYLFKVNPYLPVAVIWGTLDKTRSPILAGALRHRLDNSRNFGHTNYGWGGGGPS